MKTWLKYLWAGAAVLLLLYAFDALVLGMLRHVLNPLEAYVNNVAAAFIAIVLAVGILIYLNYSQYDKQ